MVDLTFYWRHDEFSFEESIKSMCCKMLRVTAFFAFFAGFVVPTFAADRGGFHLNFGAHETYLTTDDTLEGGGTARFGFGTGVYMIPVYQSAGRFGLLFPIAYTYQFGSTVSRLGIESDNSYGLITVSVSPLIRFFREPKSKWDPYFTAGLGGNFILDNDGAAGVHASVGAGLNYHVNERWAFHGEALFRPVFFTGNVLNQGADVPFTFEIPVSIGMSYKF